MQRRQSRWSRRFRPSYLVREVRRIGKKLAIRVMKPHRRVIRLEAEGTRRGRALVSFWIDPFLLDKGQPIPISHTHYWESGQLARTWAELGYDVDVIHWTNDRFVPSVPPTTCLWMCG